MIDRISAVSNGTGIAASGAGATVRIGDSTVSGNTTGLLASNSGLIESWNNKVNGNGTDGTPSSTIAMK